MTTTKVPEKCHACNGFGYVTFASTGERARCLNCRPYPQPSAPVSREAVAWMYEKKSKKSLQFERQEHLTRPDRGWTETPLYALTPQAQPGAVREALEPFALMSTEGVVKPETGYVTVTTQAEYFHRAAEAIAALPPKDAAPEPQVCAACLSGAPEECCTCDFDEEIRPEPVEGYNLEDRTPSAYFSRAAPPQTVEGEVTVTRADREAAANLAEWLQGSMQIDGNDVTAIRNGFWDKNTDDLGILVQAFARHRLAHQPEPVPDNALVEDASDLLCVTLQTIDSGVIVPHHVWKRHIKALAALKERGR